MKGQVELAGTVVQGPWREDDSAALEPARNSTEVSIPDAHKVALSALVGMGLSDESQATARRIWSRFIRYATRSRTVDLVSEIDADLVESFCFARNQRGDQPALSTIHHRRSNVRLLFRIWRSCGLSDEDPTHDLVLPSRSDQSFRPLTDEEVEACRWAAMADPGEARPSAIWALAESGVWTAEICNIRARDVEANYVAVAGSAKTDPRSVALTDWGVIQIARRLKDVAALDSALVYDGTGNTVSRQAYVGKVIARIFARAGLSEATVISPRSIAAWAGCRIFEDSGEIDEVANRLGLRSLDRAAALIDWRWKKAVCR